MAAGPLLLRELFRLLRCCCKPLRDSRASVPAPAESLGTDYIVEQRGTLVDWITWRTVFGLTTQAHLLNLVK